MFPSEAYRELCIEHQRELREEWEPKFGDWVYLPRSEQVRLVTGLDSVGADVRLVQVGTHWLEARDLIPLFQPRQLIEMLEERGCHINIDGPWTDGYSVGIMESGQEYEDGKWFYDPDPATALLKAYLSLRDSEEEVVKDEI